MQVQSGSTVDEVHNNELKIFAIRYFDSIFVSRHKSFSSDMSKGGYFLLESIFAICK